MRSRDAVAVARAVGARAVESHALTTLGACVAEHGDPDAGIALVREAVEIAEELGRPDNLDLAYKILTHVLMEAGRLDEAAQVVVDGIARDERLVGVRLNGAGGNSAESLIRRGRWNEADDLLAARMDSGSAAASSARKAVGAMLATRRGRLEEAVVRSTRPTSCPPRLNTVQVRGWFHLFARACAARTGANLGRPTRRSNVRSTCGGHRRQRLLGPRCAPSALRALADEYDTARARRRRIDVDKLRRLAAALVEQAERHVVGHGQEDVRRPPRSIAQLAWCTAEESRLHHSEPGLG